MSDEEAQRVYDRLGIGGAMTPGVRPAVLVVDFSCGFTDPSYAAGSDLSAEVRATRRLLEEARGGGHDVIFTTVGYARDAGDAGIWPDKFPALRELIVGDRSAEVDPRLGRCDDETLIVKKGASAFFGTNLSAILVARRIDTIILCGATTSGCIRATAVDLMQHGFPALVPRECVGDRARAPHESNLFDIQAKYADVVSVDEAISYLAGITAPARAMV